MESFESIYGNPNAKKPIETGVYGKGMGEKARADLAKALKELSDEEIEEARDAANKKNDSEPTYH